MIVFLRVNISLVISPVEKKLSRNDGLLLVDLLLRVPYDLLPPINKLSISFVSEITQKNAYKDKRESELSR